MPVRLTVCSPSFSLMVRLAIVSKVGAWLTALTVTTKARLMVLLVAWPSLTVTVIVTLPNAEGNGGRAASRDAVGFCVVVVAVVVISRGIEGVRRMNMSTVVR